MNANNTLSNQIKSNTKEIHAPQNPLNVPLVPSYIDIASLVS